MLNVFVQGYLPYHCGLIWNIRENCTCLVATRVEPIREIRQACKAVGKFDSLTPHLRLFAPLAPGESVTPVASQ
jgi:hypothetical protein